MLWWLELGALIAVWLHVLSVAAKAIAKVL